MHNELLLTKLVFSKSGKNQWFLVLLDHIQTIYAKKSSQKIFYTLPKIQSRAFRFPVCLVKIFLRGSQNFFSDFREAPHPGLYGHT